MSNLPEMGAQGHESPLTLTLGEVSESLEELRDEFEQFRFKADPSFFAPTLFLAQVHTDNTWAQAFVVNGTIGTSGTVGQDAWGSTSPSDGVNAMSLGNYSVLLRIRDSNQWRFIALSGAGQSQRVKINITGHAGTGPTDWNPYIGTLPNGQTTNAYSRAELNGIAGTPGSLGIDVGADGSTTGGCFIWPAGTGNRMCDWDAAVGWVFEFENSSDTVAP